VVLTALMDKTDKIISCGKTTLARLLARRCDAIFKELSATGSGVNDVRAIFEEAKSQLILTGRSADYFFAIPIIECRPSRFYFCSKTVLFLDEVHRFNTAQQVSLNHHAQISKSGNEGSPIL
jgi:putative ATPase